MKSITNFVLVFFLLFGVAGDALPGSNKHRIISLTPATTEILFALGLDKEIIAVSSFCAYPEKAKEKEKAGSFSSPNIEKIIALNPDLVLVTGMEQENLKIILSSLNIEYICIDPKNIEELMDAIYEIGSLTGALSQADTVNSRIKETLKYIQADLSANRQDAKPRVYMEIWYDPVMSPGRGSFVHDMIEKAGGINITSTLKRSYSRIDPERIIYENPDKIVLAYMKPDSWVKENFANRLGWQDIKAVRSKSIYSGIDPDILLRPGPRVAEGLIALYEIFYEK
jgi:iron complex transport system substrate-binding protein